jgi:hypothetical protein
MPNSMNWKRLCLKQHICISHHQFHNGWISGTSHLKKQVKCVKVMKLIHCNRKN